MNVHDPPHFDHVTSDSMLLQQIILKDGQNSLFEFQIPCKLARNASVSLLSAPFCNIGVCENSHITNTC